MPAMTTRETEILDAALRVFSRYGVKRSSMGDLAQEAGVSRQTLYNLYRNKDEILRALIRAFTQTALREIAEGVARSPHLGDQLDIVFDKMVLAGVDLTAAMPNAQDLIDGFNSAGRAEQEASAQAFRAAISGILTPHEAALSAAGLTVDGLADLVQHAAKATTRGARDRAHVQARLQALRALCLAAAWQ